LNTRHDEAHALTSYVFSCLLQCAMVQKISTKFQRSHPNAVRPGRQIKVGHVTMSDFQPISRYISERMQDS